MSTVKLTPAALQHALAEIAQAKTEGASRVALVTAATMMQSTILNKDVSGAEFTQALDSCPDYLVNELKAVMDRTVDFHTEADGGTLGLWLLPVSITMESAELPESIPLELTSINYLKMSAALLKQLGLADGFERINAGGQLGWNYIVPTLFHSDCMTSADLEELVKLPREARAVVRGTQEDVYFDAGEFNSTPSNVGLYYLPVVAFHPEEAEIKMPAPSSQMQDRMALWAGASLQAITGSNEVPNIVVAEQPHPFSIAVGVGEGMARRSHIEFMMGKICEKSGVQPNGLYALVAPYLVGGEDGPTALVVSLVSRMTRAEVGSMVLPVEDSSDAEAVSQAVAVLRGLGMEAIEVHEEAEDTFACQHCGQIQYALPNVAAQGQLSGGASHH